MANPKLIRFTVDMVVAEPIPDHRMETIARELTEHLHVIGTEPEDQVHKEVDKLAVAHVHDTAGGDRCSECLEESLDFRSGATVLQG